MGFVFQSYALFKHMTLAENIAFGPRTRKLDMDIDGRWASPALVRDLHQGLSQVIGTHC